MSTQPTPKLTLRVIPKRPEPWSVTIMSNIDGIEYRSLNRDELWDIQAYFAEIKERINEFESSAFFYNLEGNQDRAQIRPDELEWLSMRAHNAWVAMRQVSY